MSRANTTTATMGDDAHTNASGTPVTPMSFAQTRRGGLRLAASLTAVAVAGLIYWIAGRESIWVAPGFLAALACGSAFLLMGFGWSSGGSREALLTVVACGAAIALAYASLSGNHLWLAAAFGVQAIAGAVLEWWASPQRHELLAWLGPWSSFHAVMAVLLWS